MSNWVVVMTRPNCEAIAAENLLKQGYGCYFPRFLAIQRHKLVTVKKPLFPRYIFALIDKFWYSIRGTRGVSQRLMADDGPAKVPHAVIDAIRSKEDNNGFIVLSEQKSPERFSKGTTVRATEGPLTGIDLIYDGMAPHDRVKVLATLLGRQVPVTIEENILVAG